MAIGKLLKILDEAAFEAKLPGVARRAAHTVENTIRAGIPLSEAGVESLIQLLKKGADEYALYRILRNTALYTTEVGGTIGTITREELLEKLVTIANKSEPLNNDLMTRLIYRLKAQNASAAKGFITEVYYAAEKSVQGVSRNMKIDKLIDVDAVMTTGEYCQIKNVATNLGPTKSVTRWISGAAKDVGIQNVRIVLPQGLTITAGLRQWLRKTHGLSDGQIDNLILAIKYP